MDIVIELISGDKDDGKLKAGQLLDSLSYI